MSGTLRLLLALTLLTLPAAPAAGADPLRPAHTARPVRTARLARGILAEPRFQRSASSTAESDAGREAPSAGEAGRVPGSEAELPALPAPPADAAVAAAGGAALLFKTLLVCVLAAVLLVLLSRLPAGRSRTKRRPADVVEPAAARVGGGAGNDLDAADRLAAAGRYGEALHALLLLAIGQLSERCARPPSPSRTSRELVRLLPLETAARDAFAALVAMVERTLFGGCVAAAGDFQTARSRTLQALAPAAGSRGVQGGHLAAGGAGGSGDGIGRGR